MASRPHCWIEPGAIIAHDDPADATVEDLGLMMLRHHIARAIGVDPYDADGMDRLAAVDLEIKTNPLITFPADPAEGTP